MERGGALEPPLFGRSVIITEIMGSGSRMSTKYLFNRCAFIRQQGPVLVVVFIISIILDFLFIWYLGTGLPINVASKSEALLIWKIVFIFLILINALTLKVWNIYGFINKLTKWQTGYVEIAADEILHCVEKCEISKSRVKFERGYVVDESKKIFDYELNYRINQVEKYERTTFGKLKIKGKIELDCLDEYNGLEMGVADRSINKIKNHSIPAYYEGMDIIQSKLDEMVSKKRANGKK
ncbi:MAG: hypothetical protein FP831_14200 [Anaerolineae bacterium]|nr:hypothetical protein [Anaerolineae bacterium]